MWSWDQVDFLSNDPDTKGKENIMNGCTYSATLEELLNRPMGQLALRGFDGEDDGAKPGSEQGEDGEKPDESNNEDGDDDKGGDGETETVETLTRKLANSEEARNRNADKRKELETENATLKSKIKQMEKDGTPDDAIKKQNEDLNETNAKLVAVNQNLMLQIAMRDDKAHDWVDPDAALRLADLSDVEFDEKTNKAIGLKAALDKLAKDKPYLLKAKDDEEGGQRQRTGRPPGGGKGGKQDAAARAAALRAKYPGLRR